MTIDYSKWDKLEVSDEEEITKLNVVKLNPNQQVILEKEGYRIKDNNSTNEKFNIINDSNSSKYIKYKLYKNIDFNKHNEDVSNYWYKKVLYGIVTINSHIFSQDRYLINFLLLIDFEYKKLKIELDDKTITIYDSDKKLFNKEFYSKINKDETFWNWELVTLEIDWDALKSFSQKINNEKKKTDLYFKNKKKLKFLEVNLHKLIEIQDCFIWWPKLFKDDVEEIRVVDNSEFMKVWDEAHEKFRKKISNYNKIQI